MIEQNLGTDRLQYHLKAFLISLKSVFDYLLEDYNKKYSLGFTEDEDLNAKRFEKKARQLGQNEAQRFIAWWKLKKGQVKSDRRYAFLLARHGRRDLIVHRKAVPMLTDVQTFDSGPGGEHVRIEKYEFYFDGFDDEKAVSVCQHCFKILKNVIEEARRNFPLKREYRNL